MKNLEILFLLFMIYSFLGWVVDIIGHYLSTKKIINRGFFIGPYCPIYGFGALFISFFLYFVPVKNYLFVFISCIFICSLLEYVTSYVLEKVFHARWWDYSDEMFHINGRICLKTMIPFGFLGFFIHFVTNPFFIYELSQLSCSTLFIICILLIILFTIDIILSFQVLIHFRTLISSSKAKDKTEDIREILKDKINKHQHIHKRLLTAYPIISKKINQFIKKIKL